MLSMYVKTSGYGMSKVVKTKGPTDMFATTWAVKMLNFLGLSDIILQCDPEPSLINWAESVKSKQSEQSFEVLPYGHIKVMQGVENCQKTAAGTSCERKSTRHTDHPLTTH